MKRDFIGWVCLAFLPDNGMASVESLYLNRDEERRPANAIGKLFLIHSEKGALYQLERV